MSDVIPEPPVTQFIKAFIKWRVDIEFFNLIMFFFDWNRYIYFNPYCINEQQLSNECGKGTNSFWILMGKILEIKSTGYWKATFYYTKNNRIEGNNPKDIRA